MPRSLATGRTLANKSLKTYSFLTKDFQKSLYVPLGIAGGAMISDVASIQNLFSGTGGAFSFWIKPRSLGGSNAGQYLNKHDGVSNGWFCRVAGSVAIRLGVGFSTTAGEFRIFNGGFKINDWNWIFCWYNSGDVATVPTSYIYIKTFNTFVKPTVQVTTPPVGAWNTDVGTGIAIGNLNALSNRGSDAEMTGIQLWKGTLPTQPQVMDLLRYGVTPSTLTLIDTWSSGAGANFVSNSGTMDAVITAPAALTTEVPYKTRTLVS